METPLNPVESLLEPIEAYVTTTYELSKLKLLQKATVVISWLIARISVVLLIALFILVLNLGVASWLGEVLGKPFYGLFIVAGFDLVAGIVSYFFLYNWIRKPVSNRFIKKVLK